MKRMILAALIAISLITLSSSFVQPENHPPGSSGHALKDSLSNRPLSKQVPATSNEPVSQTSTPAPSFTMHVPVTINLGKVSDLSFIYEGSKLAYVQFYSQDYDRLMRIPYEDYQKLASTGKFMSYGFFTPGDHGQAVRGTSPRNGMQGRASGLNKYIASVREITNTLRGITQGMINSVRTQVLPAADHKIVTPLRDFTQGMINKVRIAMTKPGV